MQLNRAAEQITGFGSDEVRERPVFLAIVVPEEVDLMRGVLERLERGESPVTFHSAILTKHSERRMPGAFPASAMRAARSRPSWPPASTLPVRRRQKRRWPMPNRPSRPPGNRSSGCRAGQSQPARGCPKRSPSGRAGCVRSSSSTTRPAPSDAKSHAWRIPTCSSWRRCRAICLPPRAAFKDVLCHDISASGFSFFADQPPAGEFLVVGLRHRNAAHLSQGSGDPLHPPSRRHAVSHRRRYTGRAAMRTAVARPGPTERLLAGSLPAP